MNKPIPSRSLVGQPFWEAVDECKLRYQRCTACNKAQYYPRALCSHCASSDLRWEVSSGRGTVYSYTDIHRAPNEAFKPDVPYVIALVDVEEGFRTLTNVIAPAGSVTIGMFVRAVFEDRGDGKLLQFEPAT